jgi:hypothetical protein
MKHDKRNEYSARDRTRALPVDKEVARHWIEESAGPPAAGDEYIDLERLFHTADR